jgi:hypothetical protein
MEYELASLSAEELINLYHKINAELTTQFLNRTPWELQQERVNNLSKISKELSQRKVVVERPRDTNNHEPS